MKIQHVFSSFLLSDNLDIDNDVVLNFCNKNKKLGNSYQHHLTLKEQELQDFYYSVNKRLSFTNELLNLKPIVKHKIFNGWVNFDCGNNITKPHNHARQFLTVVYYVKADANSGDLVLKNPNDAHTYVIPTTPQENVVEKWNEFNTFVHNITPKTGSLFVFPSWLFHYVKPFEGERISIALNTRIYVNNYSFFGGVVNEGN